MTHRNRILVADDDQSISLMIADVLKDEGFIVEIARNGVQALDVLRNNSIDVVLLDLKMPGKSGMDVLAELRKANGEKPEVLIISAHGSIPDAVKALKLGALDFIEKPIDVDRLLISVNIALEKKRLSRENRALRRRVSRQFELIGECLPIRKLMDKIDRIANTRAGVLILGENGTGKDLVAKIIHHKSERSMEPFVMVNCAAIPRELVESELFGCERGAFTGAVSRRKGRFEQAANGTLMLNEIGELSLEAQAKLLSVIETKEFCRVGGGETVPVDVRIIAATNIDMKKAISEKSFREDLYYRLNIIQLKMPPLRERGEDVLLLADHLLEDKIRAEGLPLKEFTLEARQWLRTYHWPGNVRELQNLIEKIVLFIDGPVVRREDLQLFGGVTGGESISENTFPPELKNARAIWEKDFLQRCLLDCDYNISAAAERLGVHRTHLHRLISQHNIPEKN